MQTKTLDDIRKEVLETAKKETGLQNFKSVGVLRSIWEVYSRMLYDIYDKYINAIYTQTSLLTATGLWLDQWGLLVGLTRKDAVKTAGIVTCEATSSGKIEEGLWITITGTSYRYKVTKAVSFEAGTVQIPVEAEFTGSAYNIDNVEGDFSKVITGLGSVKFPDSWYTTLGSEEETDSAYRTRIQDFWISYGENNSPRTYKYYAESVQGVREVMVIRTPRGYGTTDIIVASVDGMPSQELLDKVYTALYDNALICTELKVLSPTEKSVEINVEYKGSAEEDAVKTVVDTYVKALGIGGRLEVRQIYDLLESFELDQLEVTTPTRDVQASERELITANITVTKLSTEA